MRAPSPRRGNISRTWREPEACDRRFCALARPSRSPLALSLSLSLRAFRVIMFYAEESSGLSRREKVVSLAKKCATVVAAAAIAKRRNRGMTVPAFYHLSSTLQRIYPREPSPSLSSLERNFSKTPSCNLPSRGMHGIAANDNLTCTVIAPSSQCPCSYSR